jgi:uncharacterized protein (TIGR03066 family)
MFNRSRWTPLSSVALLLLGGCFSSDADRLVGKWNVSGLPGFRGAARKNSSVALEFKEGGELKTSVTAQGKTSLKTAQWKLLNAEADKLTIETKKTSGKNKRREKLTITFVDEDRCTVTKGNGNQAMELTRK